MVTVPVKSFDIFCGTGGVGKTTLATARAFSLVQSGKKVLLVTIDPARRLKDILGLSDDSAGEVTTISLEKLGISGSGSIDALLMSPEKTIARMAAQQGIAELATNRIVATLCRPYGGMNEILSIIELQMLSQTGKYDCIVLDTPPGPHFLDFLEGMDKIRTFFDRSFVEIFTSLGRKATDGKGLAAKLFDKVVGAGIKKLLSYLQHVTGAQFVEDFLGALELIYRSRGAFMQGLAMQARLTDNNLTNWFLVTSVEQGKAHEALEIHQEAKRLLHSQVWMALNKCLSHELAQWEAAEESPSAKLRDSLLNKEKMLRENLGGLFLGPLLFPEVLQAHPIDHVKTLTENWKQYAASH